MDLLQGLRIQLLFNLEELSEGVHECLIELRVTHPEWQQNQWWLRLAFNLIDTAQEEQGLDEDRHVFIEIYWVRGNDIIDNLAI